jgi:hypothetical protein
MSEAKVPESIREKLREGILYLQATGEKSVTIPLTKTERETMKCLEKKWEEEARRTPVRK